MFPNAFDYVAPRSLEEVLAALEQHGDDAKVLAGGQSLLPMMKLRVAAPAVLVDINRVSELSAGVSWEESAGELTIGALTRHVTLERDRDLAAQYPLLRATAAWIADPLVRNRGTMAGSLAHADPAADWGAAMTALKGSVTATGPSGSRRIAVDDFFQDIFTTSLDPHEIVTHVHIPKPRGRVASRYLKLERKVGDFAVVGVALQVVADADGLVQDVGIGLAAVGPKSLRAVQAERVIAGSPLTEDVIREAAALAAADADPTTDQRGSAAYKRDVVRVFVERGLRAIRGELQEAARATA
jgi:carbon-monoxide dehydrogenase medium subunit